VARLRRLLLLNIPSPIKYLHEKLPNKAKLGLYFNPYGKVLDLIDDCISCGVDKLIDEAGGRSGRKRALPRCMIKCAPS
jgi:ATP-dependent helicase HrpA